MNLDKMAIIGFGSIGKKHFLSAKKIKPEIKISTVSSQKLIAKSFPIHKKFSTISAAILDGIQAAIISNPAPYHIKSATELINADVNVLIEKPLSINSIGIDKLIAAEKKSTAKALVGYCYRHDKNGNFFRQKLKEKVIGEILSCSIFCSSYLPEWRKDKNYQNSVSAKKSLGGGVLLELSHELDYCNWIFDGFKSVFCYAQNSGTLNIESDDQANLILISKDNIPVNIHLNFNSRLNERNCIVRGTKGNMIWDIFNKKVYLQKPNSNKRIIFNDSKCDIYDLQLNHFFDCIEKNLNPCVELDDGLKTMKLIDAAIASNQSSMVSRL